MPQTLVGTENCPHIYHEDIAIAHEGEFCDIDDNRCVGEECVILHEIKKKKVKP
jgi:hypothetical protein